MLAVVAMEGGVVLTQTKTSISHRVLLVDDDEAVRSMMGMTLEGKGFDVVSAGSVRAHREGRFYLEGPFQGQVNGQIQAAYAERGRYDELGDAKYTDAGAIFDIMSITVIHQNLQTVE